MKKSIIAAAMAGTLLVTGITGCRKIETQETTTAATTTAAETTTAAADTGEEETLNYSKGISDNGFIEGIRCLDYVTLPDFSELTFKKADIERSAEDIETDIAALSQVFPNKITDREIVDQDYVSIDYTGYMDGEAFSGGSATDSIVVAGSDNFIDDFLTQIIGHVAGDEFDIEVTFPDPYPNNTDFSGKDATFSIKINYIAEYPEITDAWIAENQTLVQETLGTDAITDRQALVDYIYDYYYEDNLKQEIYNYINDGESITVSEIPEEAYNVAANIVNCECVRQYGYTLDSLISSSGDSIKSLIESDARNLMIYQAIAEQQGWDSVSIADLEELTGEKDNAARVEAYGAGYLVQTLLYYRTYDYLAEVVTVED